MYLNETNRALVSTVLAGVLWGTSFPVIKVGLAVVDPYTFVFLRMLLASVLALGISWVTNNLRITSAKQPLVWSLGVLNGFAYLIQYVGMNYTTASKSSLFVNLSVVWVAVLSSFFLKEQFSRKKTAGIISGFIGVFLITTNLDLLQLTQGMIIGDGLVILSGVLWSFFILFNKRLTEQDNAIRFMPWMCIATTLPLVLFLPLFSTISVSPLTLEAWRIIGYTAVFCWVVPYYFWVKGLQHITPTSSAVLLLLEVVTAMFISWLVLGETFTFISIVGGSFILIAIVFVSIR